MKGHPWNPTQFQYDQLMHDVLTFITDQNGEKTDYISNILSSGLIQGHHLILTQYQYVELKRTMFFKESNEDLKY